MTEDLITIGRITKHQGNKGEVRVMPLTDYPERFELLERVVLEKDSQQQEVIIESLRYHKQFVILKFVGFDDIGAAIELKDALIKIAPEEAIELPEEHYYLHDILGLEVVTVEGRVLGEIKDILETGSNDVYVVRSKQDEYLIPALKKVVTKVDLETGKMTIKPIKGLL